MFTKLFNIASAIPIPLRVDWPSLHIYLDSLLSDSLVSRLNTSLTGSSICLLAWVAGVSSLLIFQQLPPLQPLILLAVFSFFVATKYRVFWPILVAFTALSWACWNFGQHFQLELPSEYESTSITILGQVVDLPNSNQERIRFRFRVEDTKFEKLDVLHGQLLQLSCYRCELTILADQRWQFTVRLKRPNGYASWGSFDYERYLFRHKIIATGYVRAKEENQLLATGAWSVNQYRWQIRDHLDRVLSNYPQAKGMITALMIGDKSFLSNKQKDSFQATGVSHLMAISGLHVGLVFIAIATLFKWLLFPFARIYLWQPRQRLVLFPALLAAFSYSALAGFAISTQRAFVMLSVFVICKLCAREASLAHVLLLAAALLLMIDPFSILDVGFWLSCGAVLIIALTSKLKGNLSLIKLQPVLWLGMIPLSMLFFGQISIISPLVNLLMVPLFCLLLIPLVLLSLILLQTGFDGLHRWLIESLAWAFEIVDFVLTKLTELPFALYFPASFPLWQLLLIVALLLSFLFSLRSRYLAGLIIILVLFVGRYQRFSEEEVWITLLDVGQGLAMVIEAKDYVLVYDTGPAYSSGFSAANAVLLPYLRHRGISKIDDLIISHADNDHIGGLAVLQSAYEVERTLTSRVDKIPNATECEAGQAWKVGNVDFKILSPDSETPAGSNNRSCVLLINNGRYRVLITGDIEKPVERYLVRNQLSLEADFLLVPHQGSKTSSTDLFIDAVKPSVALIAAGYKNHYGHPHSSVIERYKKRSIEMFSSVGSGSLTLRLNRLEWTREAYRESRRGFWHRQKEPF